MKSFLSVFVIATLGFNACSKSSDSASPAPVQPAAGVTDAEKQKAEQQAKTVQAPVQVAPVQEAPVQVAPGKGKPFKGSKGIAPTTQYPVPGQLPPTQGQLPPTQGQLPLPGPVPFKGGSLPKQPGQGTTFGTAPRQGVVQVQFAQKIVGAPNERLALSTNNANVRLPSLVNTLEMDGYSFPAGSKILGELLLQEGDSSIVTAREILMANGSRYAVSGDMYVDSTVDVVGQDNLGNIVGGAAVGAGLSALIQSLLGGSVGVEYTILGAVVGGLVASTIPNDRTVVIIAAGTQTEGILTAR